MKIRLPHLTKHFLSLPPDHPDLRQARSLMRQGECPLCHRSGFSLTMQHVTRIHDLTSLEVRDILGATKQESLCTSSHADMRRQFTDGLVPGSIKGTKPDTFSRAGRILRIENAEKRRGSGLGYCQKASGTFEAYGACDRQGNRDYLGCFKTELAAAYAAWASRVALREGVPA